jgi:hypothetical protein
MDDMTKPEEISLIAVKFRLAVGNSVEFRRRELGFETPEDLAQETKRLSGLPSTSGKKVKALSAEIIRSIEYGEHDVCADSLDSLSRALHVRGAYFFEVASGERVNNKVPSKLANAIPHSETPIQKFVQSLVVPAA